MATISCKILRSHLVNKFTESFARLVDTSSTCTRGGWASILGNGIGKCFPAGMILHFHPIMSCKRMPFASSGYTFVDRC